jgi:hypothetical protein
MKQLLRETVEKTKPICKNAKMNLTTCSQNNLRKITLVNSVSLAYNSAQFESINACLELFREQFETIRDNWRYFETKPFVAESPPAFQPYQTIASFSNPPSCPPCPFSSHKISHTSVPVTSFTGRKTPSEVPSFH